MDKSKIPCQKISLQIPTHNPVLARPLACKLGKPGASPRLGVSCKVPVECSFSASPSASYLAFAILVCITHACVCRAACMLQPRYIHTRYIVHMYVFIYSIYVSLGAFGSHTDAVTRTSRPPPPCFVYSKVCTFARVSGARVGRERGPVGKVFLPASAVWRERWVTCIVRFSF
jgi:hypothetical protein